MRFSTSLVLLLAAVQTQVVTPFPHNHYGILVTRQRRQQQQQRCNHIQLYESKASEEKETLEKPFSVSSSRGSKAIQTKSKTISGEKQSNGWDSFKSALYGAVDGVETISEKLGSSGGAKSLDAVEGGYSTLEKNIRSSTSSSPGQRLMEEYRSRSSTASSSVPSNGGSQESAFDAWKSTVYGAVDAASQAFAATSSFDNTAASEDSFQSFKPVVQSTLSSSEIQKALLDLQSSNVIKRKLAESKIKNYDEKERKREREQQREEAARKFKESVYQIGDGVVLFAETLATVPSKVSYAAEETGVIAKKVKTSVDKVPEKVDGVVATVSSLPDRVKVKSEQVQSSVKTGVESTKKAIEEVKEIPKKFSNTVKETQEKVEAAIATVDDVTTTVKVRLGLEKPKPKPPKVPPPPPSTAGQVGLKIAGSVAKGVAAGTAKFAWWAGKGAAVTAWNGVQSAVQKNKQDEPSMMAGTTTNVDKDVPTTPTPVASMKSKVKEDVDTVTSTSTSTSKDEEDEDDGDVDKEVKEALLLAESAILFADKSSTDYSSMTVEQLKGELRKRGLKVSGRKAELIERLQSSD